MAKRNRTMKALLLAVVMLLAIQLSPLVFATEAEETETTEPTTVETTVATEADETEATTEPTTAPTTEPDEDDSEEENDDVTSDETTEPENTTSPVEDQEPDLSGSLTIRVSGAENADCFLFTVASEKSNVTVVVQGNGSVTVSGMQVDVTYTVTQNTDWSWQYVTEESVKECSLTAEDKVQEITFTQTVKEEICGASGSAYVQEMLVYKEEA